VTTAHIDYALCRLCGFRTMPGELSEHTTKDCDARRRLTRAAPAAPKRVFTVSGVVAHPWDRREERDGGKPPAHVVAEHERAARSRAERLVEANKLRNATSGAYGRARHLRRKAVAV
jgi:hypothetical protein